MDTEAYDKFVWINENWGYWNDSPPLPSFQSCYMLFNKEVKWRKDAAQNLMPEIEKYNLVIKDNIGLRLQSRLTKDQAKFVASCNSIHRDISLNF